MTTKRSVILSLNISRCAILFLSSLALAVSSVRTLLSDLLPQPSRWYRRFVPRIFLSVLVERKPGRKVPSLTRSMLRRVTGYWPGYLSIIKTIHTYRLSWGRLHCLLGSFN